MSPGSTKRPGHKNRTAPTGHLRFDRKFPSLGVDRIQHSSGTSDQREFRRRNDILTRLARTENAETLSAFAKGEIDIETLVRFDREENLRFGLRDLRTARGIDMTRHGVLMSVTSPSVITSELCALSATLGAAVTSEAASAIESIAPSSPMPASRPAPTGGWDGSSMWPGVSLNSDFQVPLWDTCLDTVIPGMLHLQDTTRRRYETSIRALRQKLAPCRATEEQFELLAGIAPDTWEALGKANMRMTTQKLREAVALPIAKQRVLLAQQNVRLNVDVLQQLQCVTADEWDVLVELAAYPITSVMVEALDKASAVERTTLRGVAHKLGEDATLASLGTVTAGEWHVLSAHWGASGTDWNHMRRALSACLSTYIGTDRFPYRQIVIDRIPLLDENERIPDITLDTLGAIVAHLPEIVRLFPWFIVLSGCRIGEYLRLEPTHLKPNTHAVDIPGTKTTASRRTIHIDPAAWWIVEATVPCYLQYGRLRRVWLDACAQAGVSGVTIHDLRHLCGQSAANAGMPLSTIKDHLGHANIAMAERYARRRMMKEGAALLGGFVTPHIQQEESKHDSE